MLEPKQVLFFQFWIGGVIALGNCFHLFYDQYTAYHRYNDITKALSSRHKYNTVRLFGK